MDFNDHSMLRGSHALLSPSNYHWLNYDRQKMKARLTAHQASARGTRIHAWAHEAINLKMRQKLDGNHIDRYINDGIGHQMMTDFMVYYSRNAYGEADTLSYRMEKVGRKKMWVLRINDLKTGLNMAGITQLEVYATYFCLEYGLNPEDIHIILTIYQNDQLIGGEADPVRIREHMNRTIERDQWIQEDREEFSSATT